MGSYLEQLIDINGLPLLSCLVVSGILVYLGMHVVERKVIFVDLALAQIAALGVMWAILMGYDHETDTLAVTLYSLAFTAIGALVFSITRTRNERVPHEALIGIIYVTASAGGLVLADRFALGTEALKELIAGRVALVTPTIVAKLAITCAVVAAVFAVLHRRFLRISRDPAAAEAAGVTIRAWDFLFYLLFGLLITQCVAVLGVLPVFAYLVIPAVSGAFLFSSVRGRLVFGWAFAGVISLVGLETARVSQLDPGPTIVCLFAGALILLGVVLFLRTRRFALRAILGAVGFAILFAVFLGGTLAFHKTAPTDELATAIEFARSPEPTRLRQAIESFHKFPNARGRWGPMVIAMLDNPDPVARQAAATLLGETKATEAVAALGARLGKGVAETERSPGHRAKPEAPDRRSEGSAESDVRGDRMKYGLLEPEDEVREAVVRALRAIGDPHAVHALVDAATREPESDLAVAMAVAAFELAGTGQDAELRRVGDVLAQVISDDSAPHAARRDAGDALRAHVSLGACCRDDAAAAAWWRGHRDAVTWQAPAHLFVPSATGG